MKQSDNSKRLVSGFWPDKKTTIELYGQIEGPFNIGDPVHEVLTLLTIEENLKEFSPDNRHPLINGVASGLVSWSSSSDHNISPEKIHLSAQQFIRGVVWPDDPRGYLFDNNINTLDYSSGLAWYSEFKLGSVEDPKNLIARSHRGDLQFFHAMASRDGEAVETTKAKIIKWLSFCLDAAAILTPDMKVKKHPFLKRIFASHHHKSLKSLLLSQAVSDLAFKQRVVGALLHTIQDSYFCGHVKRKEDGSIKQFHVYQSQDSSAHNQYDGWNEGETLRDRINNTFGAKKAVEQGIKVMKMLLNENTTEEIIEVIDREILKIASDAVVAGPGKKFKD